MRKLLLGMLSLFALVLIAACGTDPIDVESVTLDGEDMELEVGETVTVSATVEPEDADNLEVRWSTSNSQVAVVSEGEIQALRPGSATITATSRADEDISDSITITVIAGPMSVDDVLDAEEGDEVNTIGVVTAITNHATFFIEDDTGAIAVYDGDAAVIEDLSVGDEVRLWGEKGNFNGLLQVTNITRSEVLSSGNDLPNTVDIDDVDIENNNQMAPYQAHRVNLAGFLVEDISTDDYDNIMVDLFSPFTEKTITIRYDSRLGHEDDAAALLELEENDLIDVTGMILGWYNGPQLLFTSADEFQMSDMSLDLALEVEVEEDVELQFNGTMQITWTVQPIAYAAQNVTFISSDEDVATVDADGLVTAQKSGTTTITVEVVEDSSLTFSFDVHVEPFNAYMWNLASDATDITGEDIVTITLYNTQVFSTSFWFDYEWYFPFWYGHTHEQGYDLELDDDSIVTLDETTFTADETATGSTLVTVTSTYDDSVVGQFYIEVTEPQPEIIFPSMQQIVFENTTYDMLDDVFATDPVDGDISDSLVVVDDDGFTLGVPGTYEVVVSATNSYGVTVEKTRTIQIMEEGQAAVTYPTGVYNFKFADPETRNVLFAYAERFLMETMYGGIPVNVNAGFALYSERLVFPVDEYVPVMGFGTGFGDFTADDSNVEMEDGNPGNVGEKTYRHAMTSNPATFDQWNYDDAVTADIATQFLDSLYYFAFNDDYTGYEVLPSMATDMPMPYDADGVALIDEDGNLTEDAQEIYEEFGNLLAKTWRVSLRDDLMWTFHEDTDSDGLSQTIDANDFIDTYKLALEENWFRAISGGGDFTSAPQEIVNAQAFADGEVEWAEVGLRAVDDYTLEFTFVENMDEWNVIYWLSSFVMTPIHLELYDELGDLYGTSAETTAYHGAYTVTYFEPDQIVRLEENPNFHSPERYNYTGHTWRVIEDVEIRFQEFLAGRLESVSVPSAQYEDYQDDERIRFIPGATTFRMAINSLGTIDAQLDRFPGSSFVPEPLLGWELDSGETMRNALFFAIDRLTIANEVNVTSEPQMFYFSPAYMVAPESGVSFREWDYQYGLQYQIEQDIEDGLADDEDDWYDKGLFEEDYPYTWVGRGFTPSTQGYNPDLARAIFVDIIDEMVEAGIYEPGDTIVLDLGIQSGSEGIMAYAEYVKSDFERIFYHLSHDIGVTVDISTHQFPDNYYLRSLIGVGDLNMGGIQGSTLDAASFLDVFADDNRGGFTMDWGIDTSTAEIEVTYENFEGEVVTEMWSFNALVRALNGTAYVLGGEESTKDIVAPEVDDE